MGSVLVGFPPEVARAYEQVLSASDSTNWALFTYVRGGNDLKLTGTGDGGLEELTEEWNDGLIQYAFAKVIEPISQLPKFVLISWCGDGVPVARKGFFTTHVNDVARFFKSYHVHVTGRTQIDVAPDAIMKKVKDASGANYSIHNEKPKTTAALERLDPVGSVYEPVRTDPKPLGSSTPSYKPSPSPTSVAPPPPRPAPPVQARFTPSPSSSAPPQPSSFDRVTVERERREREERESRARAEEEERERARRQSIRDREAAAAREREEREQQEAAERRARADAEERRREEERLAERERQAAAEAEEERRRAADAADAAAAVAVHAPVAGSSGVTAVILYTYEAQEDNEVDLVEGEIVTEIEKVDDGWWQGKNSSGRVGLFPANYVEEQAYETPAPIPAPPRPAARIPEPEPEPVHAGVEAVALYDYEAAEENEISFATGDLITNIEFVSDDWWQGTVASTGATGLFPGNYVERR